MPSIFDPPPHDFPDRAHRRLLEHPANLRELVEQVAPDVAPGLTFEQARLLRRDLTLPNWRSSENDLLFEIPFRQPEPANAPTILVNLLVEHQSKADPAMPLRTLLEATLHWTEQWRAWQDGHAKGEPLRLSPLLAIVFHTGEEAWKSHRRLTDLIAAPPQLHAYVPSWEPLFWQLTRQPPASLLQATGAWLRTMALVRLADAPAADFASVYEQVARSLEPLASRDKMRWHDLMGFLLGWGQYRRRDPAEITRLHEIAAASHQNVALREEIRTMSQTVQETWVDWAKAHYTAEGEARGVLRARREDLRLMLELRFGALPPELIERIESCEDLNRLRTALTRVLDVHSLEELQL